MTTYSFRPVAIASCRSFWLQDVAGRAATPPLSGAASCEVAIIGGGYCGLWTALRLKSAAPDLRITALEADICGGGASGRNGGQVHSWWAEIDLVTRLVGASEAADLCRATTAAIDEPEALQPSGQIDMDLRLGGWLWTASARAQEGVWSGFLTQGAPLALVTAAKIRGRAGTARSYPGVFEHRAGSIHPAKLAIGLRALALAKGVTIHAATPVHSIESGTPCRLITPGGEVMAAKVEIATNAWSASLAEIHPCLYVVDSQIIATPPMADPGLNGASVCDAQAHVLYWQQTPKGRVIFGRGSGRISYGDHLGQGFNRHEKGAAANRAELARVYPGLKAAEYDWTGPIDCMAEHLPVFGRLTCEANIFYGLGFNGTGIAQTPVAAHVLTSLVLDRKDAWGRSGLIGLDRRTCLPPEPLRHIGARIVRAAISRRNAAEIVNQRPGALVRYLSTLTPGR